MRKRIAAYTHPGPTTIADKIDLRPGYYYVSLRDGARWNLLLGPFENNHAKALRWVAATKEKACEVDMRAHWYGFGTARVPLEVSPPAGRLNDLLPEAFE